MDWRRFPSRPQLRQAMLHGRVWMVAPRRVLVPHRLPHGGIVAKIPRVVVELIARPDAPSDRPERLQRLFRTGLTLPIRH